MTDSLQRAIEKSGIDLEVSIYRMYGEERSAGFELTERSTGEILFSMDIDVNRPVPPTKIYGAEGLRSTDKVFRSVKDVVDLYYISKVFDLGRADIMQTLKNGGRTLGNFHGFLHRAEELGHSYEKFRFAGGVNKPPFDEVYRTVKSYIKDVLPREKERDYER